MINHPKETSALTGATQEVSLTKMLQTLQGLELAPPAPWTLVSPDGRVWQTHKVEELFAVLAPYHPLLWSLTQMKEARHG